MKNDFPKTTLIVSAILSVLLFSVFVFLLRRVSNNNRKAEESLVTWQAEGERRADVRSLDRSLLLIAPERAALETHFVSSSDVVPFFGTIEKLARESGTSAEIDSVDPLADNSGLVVNLKASGSFKAVYKFLTLLENSAYEIDFRSMDMRQSATGIGAGKAGANLQWDAIFNIKLLSFIQ